MKKKVFRERYYGKSKDLTIEKDKYFTGLKLEDIEIAKPKKKKKSDK